MKNIHVLIKPASSLCNIRCKYCFYADISDIRAVKSYGKMDQLTTESMIDHIFADLDNGDHLDLMFQGGEPTLIGLDYYKKLIQYVNLQNKSVTVSYAIQTNGLLLNTAWYEFLYENNFLVGLSIDCLPIYHDMNRVDTHGNGTFSRVIAAKRSLDSYKINYNILCTLTNQLSRNARKVFNFIKQEHLDFIQFTPCLDSLDTDSTNSYALEPEKFAQFYKTLFGYWLDELEHGNYISIKFFDDLYNLFVRHQVTLCGLTGNCQIQYVIEADGSVYPCDFFVLDAYRLGYIQENTLKELFKKNAAQLFLSKKQVLSSYCDTCSIRSYCRGGCKRMKDSIYVNSKETYCGYQAIATYFLSNLNKINTALQSMTYHPSA